MQYSQFPNFIDDKFEAQDNLSKFSGRKVVK